MIVTRLDCQNKFSGPEVLERFQCIRKFAQSDARMQSHGEVTTLLQGCNMVVTTDLEMGL